jgi:hypothetical protein
MRRFSLVHIDHNVLNIKTNNQGQPNFYFAPYLSEIEPNVRSAPPIEYIPTLLHKNHMQIIHFDSATKISADHSGSAG